MTGNKNIKMENEDPFVYQAPVFLSKLLAENLFIHQYPVRPANRDWSSLKVINAAVKPKNQIVRLEVGIDTYSAKYCVSKGEQIAINTDGPQEPRHSRDREKNKGKYFKHGLMDKIVYESSSPCTETRHYAVGMLQDHEVHVTPIKGILQFKPSCSYHDKQDKQKADKNKTDEDEVIEDEAPAQQVRVKFARQETEVAKKAREKSYETMSQRISEEPWYDTLYRNSQSDKVELERLKLFSSNSADGSALTLSAKEYVRALVPPNEEDDITPQKKSLQDQIKELLNNAKLLTFGEIRSLLRIPETPAGESALLSALGAAACCVRGVWTARELANPRSALHITARDHVLYLFSQHTYIDRRKVTAAVRLPPHEVLEIIQSVAKYSPPHGWELLIPPDPTFEEKYPEIMQRQNLYWEAKQRMFNEMLMGDNIPKRQRKKSQRESISSDTMMSPKPRGNSGCEDDGKKIKGKAGKRTRHPSVTNSDK